MKILAAQVPPGLASVASWERWLSGRKRRFAKPLDGVNSSRGFESPPLRSSPSRTVTTRPNPSTTGGEVEFSVWHSLRLHPARNRPRPDTPPDCYLKCDPRAARGCRLGRSHRALRPTARGGQGWHRGNGQGVCPFPFGFSKPSEYSKPPSDPEMGEAMTRRPADPAAGPAPRQSPSRVE